MLIKENEESRMVEIRQLNTRINELAESENTIKNTIQDLETEICDKNKVTIRFIKWFKIFAGEFITTRIISRINIITIMKK